MLGCVYVCVFVCVRAWVCVCEGERVRKRKRKGEEGGILGKGGEREGEGGCSKVRHLCVLMGGTPRMFAVHT